MTDSTTPQDDAAMSPASAGSVAARSAWGDAPVAWAAVAKNGLPLWLAYNRSDAEGAVVGMADVVPLYRAPMLTDDEREAVEFAVAHGETVDAAWRYALRGLLERMEHRQT